MQRSLRREAREVGGKLGHSGIKEAEGEHCSKKQEQSVIFRTVERSSPKEASMIGWYEDVSGDRIPQGKY